MTTPTLRQPTLLLMPVCPDCGQEIGLVRIEPAAPGHDLRTFECAQCGYSKNVDFQIKPNWAQRQSPR
jgi:transposase-like protein